MLQRAHQFVAGKLNNVLLRRFTVVQIPRCCGCTLADFRLLHEFIAQDGAKPLAIVVEVFLQQRHDAVIPDETQVFRVGIRRQAEKVAVSDLVVAVQ